MPHEVLTFAVDVFKEASQLQNEEHDLSGARDDVEGVPYPLEVLDSI